MKPKKRRLAILGSAVSGGALQIIDAAFTTNDLDPICIYDSDPQSHGRQVLGIPVVGSTEICLEEFKKNRFECAVVAIGGNTKIRQLVFENIKNQGIPLANVISQRATVSNSAQFGEGNVVLPGVYVGPLVTIHDNCYFISGTTINHHTTIHSHSYCSTGVSIASHVVVGSGCRFDTASFAISRSIFKAFSVIPAGETLMESK